MKTFGTGPAKKVVSSENRKINLSDIFTDHTVNDINLRNKQYKSVISLRDIGSIMLRTVRVISGQLTSIVTM